MKYHQLQDEGLQDTIQQWYWHTLYFNNRREAVEAQKQIKQTFDEYCDLLPVPNNHYSVTFSTNYPFGAEHQQGLIELVGSAVNFEALYNQPGEDAEDLSNGQRHFNSSFFQDGRSDVLAEIRTLQLRSQWTLGKRTRWIKQARSLREHVRHTHPHLSAYYAGRIAALKSWQTAHFSRSAELPKSTGNQTVFHPLKPGDERRCSLFECGNDAIWEIIPPLESKSYLVLCDPCRQAWQRIESAYMMPDGWDWDEDEQHTLPLMVVSRDQKLAQRLEDAESLGEVVLPLSFLLGCDLSAFLSHGSHPMTITGLLVALLLRWQSKNIVRLLFRFPRTLEGYGNRKERDQ